MSLPLMGTQRHSPNSRSVKFNIFKFYIYKKSNYETELSIPSRDIYCSRKAEYTSHLLRRMRIIEIEYFNFF
ncbi:hypothetical protein HZS_6230 [Henneguya salminicola]|nr:hypothetical protein HZS_6230 [Henneguya salminicola]